MACRAADYMAALVREGQIGAVSNLTDMVRVDIVHTVWDTSMLTIQINEPDAGHSMRLIYKPAGWTPERQTTIYRPS